MIPKGNSANVLKQGQFQHYEKHGRLSCTTEEMNPNENVQIIAQFSTPVLADPFNLTRGGPGEGGV